MIPAMVGVLSSQSDIDVESVFMLWRQHEIIQTM